MSSLTSSLSSMYLADKEAYAEKLEEMLRVKLIKIAHYDQCVLIEIAATLALNQFQQKYTQLMIASDPLLQAEETRLTEAKTKAWNDRFAAESAAYPPTLESLLWIVAKSGYTKEVAPLMNLSKATRECKNLQRVMREVMNWRKDGRGGRTQLYYFCQKGMISSVMRMLDMKSIDVEARTGGREGGWTCLMKAAKNGHLDICCLLIKKGSHVNAKGSYGMTPLHWAISGGHIQIVRLLCEHDADIEARGLFRRRPLHYAVFHGHISIVKELIEVRNADINAINNEGRTALWLARYYLEADIAAYLVLHGGIA